MTIENKNICMCWFGVTSTCAVNGTELVEDKMQRVTLFIKALFLVSPAGWGLGSFLKVAPGQRSRPVSNSPCPTALRSSECLI